MRFCLLQRSKSFLTKLDELAQFVTKILLKANLLLSFTISLQILLNRSIACKSSPVFCVGYPATHSSQDLVRFQTVFHVILSSPYCNAWQWTRLANVRMFMWSLAYFEVVTSLASPVLPTPPSWLLSFESDRRCWTARPGGGVYYFLATSWYAHIRYRKQRPLLFETSVTIAYILQLKWILDVLSISDTEIWKQPIIFFLKMLIAQVVL